MEGNQVPDIALSDQHGNTVKLSDYRGKKVVLYFYPKDDTPGCTVEACGFRDSLKAYAELDAVVIGVSADSVKSHIKFDSKFGLGFPLLADENHELAEAFGAWQEKNNYGKKYWGVARMTFLIDEEGIVRKVWAKVKPDGHAEEVIQAIKGL